MEFIKNISIHTSYLHHAPPVACCKWWSLFVANRIWKSRKSIFQNLNHLQNLRCFFLAEHGTNYFSFPIKPLKCSWIKLSASHRLKLDLFCYKIPSISAASASRHNILSLCSGEFLTELLNNTFVSPSRDGKLKLWCICTENCIKIINLKMKYSSVVPEIHFKIQLLGFETWLVLFVW